MSLMIVPNGPEAIAGSIFNRLKVKGIKVPIAAATVIATNIEMPTTNPKNGVFSKK